MAREGDCASPCHGEPIDVASERCSLAFELTFVYFGVAANNKKRVLLPRGRTLRGLSLTRWSLRRACDNARSTTSLFALCSVVECCCSIFSHNAQGGEGRAAAPQLLISPACGSSDYWYQWRGRAVSTKLPIDRPGRDAHRGPAPPPDYCAAGGAPACSTAELPLSSVRRSHTRESSLGGGSPCARSQASAPHWKRHSASASTVSSSAGW